MPSVMSVDCTRCCPIPPLLADVWQMWPQLNGGLTPDGLRSRTAYTNAEAKLELGMHHVYLVCYLDNSVKITEMDINHP